MLYMGDELSTFFLFMTDIRLNYYKKMGVKTIFPEQKRRKMLGKKAY